MKTTMGRLLLTLGLVAGVFVVASLFPGRLTAVPKPDGGVRPLVASSVFWHLCGLAFLRFAGGGV